MPHLGLALFFVALLAGTPAHGQTEWPTRVPERPVRMLSPEAVEDLAVDSLLKSGELTAQQLVAEGKSSRAAQYFKAASLGKDFKDAAEAYGGPGGGIRAAGLVAWALIKAGCPPADASDFAARTVAAGMLALKDHANQGQLEDLYRSYRASNATGGDRGVFGFRQGFLSQTVIQELRERSGGTLTQAQLEALADRTLDTYCENRRYREAQTTFRGAVVAWLKGNAIPWSGSSASLDRLIQELQAREQAFRARTQGAAFPSAGRVALAKALLKGGLGEADRVMAALYSGHFGGNYDAAGNKLASSEGVAPGAAQGGAFVLAKVFSELNTVRPVPGMEGSFEFTSQVDRSLQAKVTWSVPLRIVPGQPAIFKIQGQMTGSGQWGEVFTFEAAGNIRFGLGGIALWMPGYGGLPARVADSDVFQLTLPADLPRLFKATREIRGARTLQVRGRELLPRRLIEAEHFKGFAAKQKKEKAYTTDHLHLVFCDEPSILTPAPKATYLLFDGPCSTSYEYHWVPEPGRP